MDADKIKLLEEENIKLLINHIVSKNFKFMKKWCEDHPDYQVSDSAEYEKWFSMTRTMCNADPRAMKKLIHQLALATEIEKGEESEDD
jgi:hypothetical protein